MTSTNSTTDNNDTFFSSLISDVKSYTGTDPLLPWLRGIKKMTDSLPPHLLKQKLPRFLQKCAQTFETDARYRNDIRYLRVWMKLLDFVDDAGAVLEHMKANHIGNKRSLFYQAYALYYEKMKKFTAAENMYHLGVQNLAEPADELQKSFDQFLLRLQKHKNKRIQRHERRSTGNPSVEKLVKDNLPSTKLKPRQVEGRKVISQSSGGELDERPGENTVVVRFAKSAIVGKSEVEDARHHGLVEPTINTKEAMDAINSMFRAPLGPEPFRKSDSNKSKANDFTVFNDNDSDERVELSNESRPVEEPFQIYCDDDADDDDEENKNITKGAFVFPNPKDVALECPKDLKTKPARFREDTVVYRFVGSTISEDRKVENVLHHGLVEPTINLKEAMDDINNMFGKPIEFVRKRRPRHQEKNFVEKQNCSTFSILPDDDDESDHIPDKVCKPSSTSTRKDNIQDKICKPSSTSSRKDNDLFEQTVCTKQAMDDINKMFAMPLDL